MEYNLNCPWESLDEWQKEYINTPPEQDCFLLKGRQCGGTTAMSIKAVELCIKHFKKGEVALISSLTERQAQLMLAKALVYAKTIYPKQIARGKDKPTMHKIMFDTGAGILCYAAGEEGDSTRGYTLKKLFVDEGSRMDETYFISATPTLSVAKGSMDIGSTPAEKMDKDGNELFFYKCSKDPNFKKFYISAEDCPRHSKEFLEKQEKWMSKLQYAQEYLAQFLDEVKRVYSYEIIKEICVLERRKEIIPGREYFLGADIAGWGKDENALEILDGTDKDNIEQVESIETRKKLTTETSDKIKELNQIWKLKEIGVDDGGVGFGVFSELMNENKTKKKTKALNNASREIDSEGIRSKKLLKEEMYIHLLTLMEKGKIKLLKDDEIISSLASIQHDGERIFGSNSHKTEAIIRACHLVKNKGLKLFVHAL